MKKLLVLLMVLGLATSAQAALSLSLDGEAAPAEITIATSTTVVIDVQSSDVEPWDGLLAIVDVGSAIEDMSPSLYGEWVPPMTASGIGELGSYSVITPEIWELHVGSVQGAVVAGTQFAIAFHCMGIGDTTVVLTDFDLNTIQTMIIHQIPEPMTLALLGLGGLFLRRRK